MKFSVLVTYVKRPINKKYFNKQFFIMHVAKHMGIYYKVFRNLLREFDTFPLLAMV